MNPLNWKREHQIALLAGTLLGAAVNILIFILVISDSYYPPLWCGFGRYGWTCWLNGFWIRVLLWAAIGAGMALP